ncbi:MAG: thiamine pyrophosphate-dependent enzyme [Planctomycetota bacterium]|jgi:2-oxoglutarate ferredoxin oxidoreductase subunit beta
MNDIDIAWCPGCGNFPILKTLKRVLAELQKKPTEIVLVSGIGQAAKIPHYFRTNVFNGLHGRALPAASAIKAANPALTVIAESGDGDMYGEGGNHFIHTIRRNPNITNIVHNNMVYGLTKGQASPTSQKGFVTPVQVSGVFLEPFNPLAVAIALDAGGFVTPVQVSGVFLEPFNPLAVAIALDAGFVARAFAGDIEQTAGILKKAIEHNGYALVDIFQPCVTFNKLNTVQWFKEHTYYLEGHDPSDRQKAFEKATETEKLPLGVFYKSPHKPAFEENVGIYDDKQVPLYERDLDTEKLSNLIETFTISL